MSFLFCLFPLESLPYQKLPEKLVFKLRKPLFYKQLNGSWVGFETTHWSQTQPVKFFAVPWLWSALPSLSLLVIMVLLVHLSDAVHLYDWVRIRRWHTSLAFQGLVDSSSLNVWGVYTPACFVLWGVFLSGLLPMKRNCFLSPDIHIPSHLLFCYQTLRENALSLHSICWFFYLNL